MSKKPTTQKLSAKDGKGKLLDKNELEELKRYFSKLGLEYTIDDGEENDKNSVILKVSRKRSEGAE